jgi:superfamily II DNA/RNA helicase
MSFSDLGLSNDLCQQLADNNYQLPTSIQLAAIPAILAGKDVMAKAQTGSGKTAAFCLPVIETLVAQRQPLAAKQVQTVILAPTRELAQQISASLESYLPNRQLNHQVAYGGVAIDPQITNLDSGADILVATPGRMLDLLINQHISINELRFLVLDEADRLLDMGFADDIKRIFSFTANKPQTLLFSATFDDRFFKFGKPLVNKQVVIDVEAEASKPADIEQRVYEIDQQKKLAATCHLLKQQQWPQALLFVRSKKTADAVYHDLNEQGINSVAIHGDKSQAKREQALQSFIANEAQVLVATDVAARGIHIPQLPVVINYQLPHQAEDYIHRIGRTGRAGAKGLAISLLAVDEKHLMEAIQELLPEQPLRQWLPGFEPNLDADFSVSKKSKKSKSRSKRRR